MAEGERDDYEPGEGEGREDERVKVKVTPQRRLCERPAGVT